MPSPVSCFCEAPGTFRGLFNKRHLSFKHNLVGHPLFELQRLAQLSRTISAAHDGKWSPCHNILYKPAQSVANTTRQWVDFQSSEGVHEAIANIKVSKAWVLITGADIDPEYRALLDEMLASGEQVFGTNYRDEVIWSTLSILVGSPNSVTHFHVDTESNFLFQIHGHKEAHLFDCDDRKVLSEQDIEQFVAVSDAHIRFDPEFEARSTVYDVQPGDGIHIPPFAPHWVRNLGEYSVTATALFYTRTATDRAWVYQCNHLLRQLGMKPSPPGSRKQLDQVKSGLIRAISKRDPHDRYEVLRSGVQRLTAPYRMIRSKLPAGRH